VLLVRDAGRQPGLDGLWGRRWCSCLTVSAPHARSRAIGDQSGKGGYRLNRSDAQRIERLWRDPSSSFRPTITPFVRDPISPAQVHQSRRCTRVASEASSIDDGGITEAVGSSAARLVTARESLISARHRRHRRSTQATDRLRRRPVCARSVHLPTPLLPLLAPCSTPCPRGEADHADDLHEHEVEPS
jgi:hypothetical protein